MPAYVLRRTFTVTATCSLLASGDEEALDFALDTDPDIVEDLGDGEWEIIEKRPDPEPEPAEHVDARILALRVRAIDIINNEAELVHDDDSGDRSAEVKRLVRALNACPDGRVLGRLIYTFPNEADEVFAETDDERAEFGDPVAHAVSLLPADYYSTPEHTR